MQFRCAHLPLTLIWAHLGRNKIDVLSLSFRAFISPLSLVFIKCCRTWGFPPRLPAGKMGDHGAKQQRLGVGNSTRSAFEVLILICPKSDSCGIGRSTTKPPSLTLTDRFTWRFSKGNPWLFHGNLGWWTIIPFGQILPLKGRMSKVWLCLWWSGDLVASDIRWGRWLEDLKGSSGRGEDLFRISGLPWCENFGLPRWMQPPWNASRWIPRRS